jgi:hypothetical protein
MKEVTISVPDEEYGFLMQLLQRLHFVKVQEQSGKEEFLNGLQEAVGEVNDIMAEKKQGKSLQSFLDEL